MKRILSDNGALAAGFNWGREWPTRSATNQNSEGTNESNANARSGWSPRSTPSDERAPAYEYIHVRSHTLIISFFSIHFYAMLALWSGTEFRFRLNI